MVTALFIIVSLRFKKFCFKLNWLMTISKNTHFYNANFNEKSLQKWITDENL